MSTTFVAFRMILFVMTPNTIKLSVCTCVGGCGCPSLMSVCCMGAACFALRKRAPSSASAANYMIAFLLVLCLGMCHCLQGKHKWWKGKNVPQLCCVFFVHLSMMHHCEPRPPSHLLCRLILHCCLMLHNPEIALYFSSLSFWLCLFCC